MKDPVDRAIRSLTETNSYALVPLQFGVAHLVFLGGLGLLALYQPMSLHSFLLLAVISQALVAMDNVLSVRLTRQIWLPVRAWENGARDRAVPRYP